MSQCTFCKRDFPNDQAVKAHLRWCPMYSKPKRGTTSRSQPVDSSFNSGNSLHQSSLTPTETAKSSDPFAGFLDQITKQITQQVAGPDEATRLKQKREGLLAGLCSNLVDWYHPPEGTITPEMAVAAKVAILDELSPLPIDEMPHAELTLRATAIRNRVLAPHFQRQHEQRERQNEKQHQDALRRQQDTDTRARQTIRKTALVELGVSRALKLASSHSIPPRVLAAVEWEVRARLDALLVGDETEQQVEETIEGSIERPLFEWAARIEQVESAKRTRMLDHCFTLAVPVVEATWPWVKGAVIAQLCEQFGLRPPPESSASTNAEGTSSEKQSAGMNSEAPTAQPVRRRRMRTTSPIVNEEEIVSPNQPVVPEPPARDRAAS